MSAARAIFNLLLANQNKSNRVSFPNKGFSFPTTVQLDTTLLRLAAVVNSQVNYFKKGIIFNALKTVGLIYIPRGGTKIFGNAQLSKLTNG